MTHMAPSLLRFVWGSCRGESFVQESPKVWAWLGQVCADIHTIGHGQ